MVTQSLLGFLELLPGPALLIDAAEKLLWVNDEFGALLSTSALELRGRSLVTLLVSRRGEPGFLALRKRLGHPERRTGVLVFQTAAGTPLELEADVREFSLDGAVAHLALLRKPGESASQELATQARRQENAVATWGIGIYEHDHISNTIYASPRARELYGFKPDEELTIASFGNAFYPADRDMMLATIGRAHDPSGDGVFNVLHRIIRGDGALRWLHTRAETQFGVVDGVRTAVLTTGSLRDMTERQELALELRRNEERLTEATQASQVGVFEHDHSASSQIAGTYWSPTLRQILGVDSAIEPTEEWLTSRVHDQDRERVREALTQRAVSENSLTDIEYRWVRGDGSVRWHHVRARTITADAGGQCVAARTVGTLLDITERKEQEEERQRRSAILDATPDFVSITELDGRIVYVNHAARMLLGIGPGEEVSDRSNIAAAYTPLTQDRIAHIGIPTAMREGAWRAEVELRDSTGMMVPTSIVLLAHRNSHGTTALLSTIGRDLSRERELEEQFRQSQKMEAIGRLAGGVAHDFNNLLSVILGFSALVAGRLEPENPAQKDLEEVRRAAERAAALTRQLLAFSRKQILQVRVLNLNEVVTEMQPMLRRLVDERIQLAVLPSSQLATVKGDPNQLQQVLLNLVVNARDAMPDGGLLAVEVDLVELDTVQAAGELDLAPGRYATITVTDTGHGMDPQTRRHVFEPFFTTKRLGQGTGLGLSTVFGVMRQSGGGIQLESEPGKGTTFRLFFPFTDEPVRLPPPSTVVSRPARRAVILVTEDDPQLRGMVSTTLSRAGYEVLTAGDPLEALQTAQMHNGRIDLLLTDVVMPRMNGKQLADELLLRRPETAVLFMSGYTEDTIVHHGVLDDGVDFIAKPLTPGQLLVAIQEVLARREPGELRASG